MSVRYRFMVEIYGFMHSLRTFLARAHDAITRDGHIEVEDSEDRSRRQNKSGPEIWKTVNYSTK